MLPDNFLDRKVCIVGLGYVGLTLAVAMADAGFQVHGVERDPKIIDCLRAKVAHFSEAGLNERLATQIDGGRFTFGGAVDHDPTVTVYIVTVGTPLGEGKRTNYEPFTSVMRSIAQVLKNDDLIILRSTVRVGVTRELAKPMLDAAEKRYNLTFCPERTLEGKALLELRTLPQVVGGIDDPSTFRASQLFSFLTPSIVRVKDADTAEMVKLINNTQRDLSFAFANEVAEMCDNLGISAHEVIASGNLGYPRSNLPYPGPVGGPCLEKDPYILAEGLEKKGFRPAIAMTARTWNEGLSERSITRIARYLKSQGVQELSKIAVLGLAFKGRPETDDLRGSTVVQVIHDLRQHYPTANLVSWDPIVQPSEIAALGLTPQESASEAFESSSLVILHNNHIALEKLRLPVLSRLMAHPGLIYDYWHQHSLRINAELASGVRYAALGSFA